MASPFSGMDPYLEGPAFLPDFHHQFVGCLCEAIADLLSENYEARINERVNLVRMSPEVIKLIYHNVALSQGPQVAGKPAGGDGGTMLLEPVTIPHEFLEEVGEARIEILHRPERSLVGVVEMLSPTNKTGDGFQEYRAKRKVILQQKVHLVEVDLLLAGNRLPLRGPLPDGDYYVLISRSDSRPNCQVYTWTVRQPLPTIPIPLKAPDPDVQVDLESVFKVAYERGRYAKSLRYGSIPLAPLSENDKTWAMQQMPK